MSEVMTVPDICVTSWEELKADIAALILHRREALAQAIARGDRMEAGRLKALIVYMLCDAKIFKQLSADQIQDIGGDLKFLDKPWYEFHITSLKTKYGTIRRPASHLSSFSFGQLVDADTEYSKFLVLNAKKDPEQVQHLNRLIAILYQSDPVKYMNTLTDIYSRNLPKGLTNDLKYLILQTYAHCRKYIVSVRCKTLFPSGDEGTSEGTSETLAPAALSGEPQYTGKMWQELLFDLSETPAFAGLENAKNARMYDALDYLEKKAIEHSKTKK